jgi:hypothetical protein
MDDNTPAGDEIARLRRRETELLNRIERMKKTMNETGDLSTLARQAVLFKEAQDELRRIQEKLAAAG